MFCLRLYPPLALGPPTVFVSCALSLGAFLKALPPSFPKSFNSVAFSFVTFSLGIVEHIPPRFCLSDLWRPNKSSHLTCVGECVAFYQFVFVKRLPDRDLFSVRGLFFFDTPVFFPNGQEFFAKGPSFCMVGGFCCLLCSGLNGRSLPGFPFRSFGEEPSPTLSSF